MKEITYDPPSQNDAVEETADVLGISPETTNRDWKMAKTWLFAELSGEKRRPGS
jgi:ECF sigma factor